MRRSIPGLLAALALLLVAAPAAAPARAPVELGPARAERPRPVAGPAVVNGARLAIADAPWQVHLLAAGEGRTYQCGGAILSAALVVTAAHCVVDPTTGAPFDPARIVVQAGVSHARTPAPGDRRQVAAVAPGGVAVHPYYAYDGASSGVAPDDVALLALATPLTLDGATARPIGLAAAAPAPGAAGLLTGYGSQLPGVAPDGGLYGLTTTVADPLRCGGAATALVLCVQAPAGSACEGDSGGPLAVDGALAGIASFVTVSEPGGACGAGTANGYANVAAPEIADFLRGSAAPPRAPRGGGDVSARGVFQVGGSVTCRPGTWSERPTIAFTFLDPRDGARLQHGPADTYTFAPADEGRTVACQVTATTAGGTAIARTQASPPIAPAPAPAGRPRPTLRLTVRLAPVRGGRVAVVVRVANRGAAPARRVVACAAPGRGLTLPRRLPRGARRPRGARPRACWRLGTVRPGARRTRRIALPVAARRTGAVATVTATVRAAGAPGRRVVARVPVGAPR
jgi:trypsin